MVKKSKKSKSKRVTLRQKYKIIRKVKEHHKKKAKEAKKLQFTRKKVEKDPGIPNDWPFKEQELKALEARRQRAIEELEQKKAARKERAQARKSAQQSDSNPIPDEQPKGQRVKADNSDKAFYKELVKVIEASDVILEVVDARDPLGTRCVEMEKMVFNSSPEKRVVLLLNKIDLVPREAVEKWLKYFREEIPTVAFKCSTQEQRSKLGWKQISKSSQTSDCLGAENLLKLLKNYSRSHDIKRSITVGVIGLPNVGKSSLINSLKRSHAVNVGATPGLTKSLQEVHLDKNVKLLDCPGVVLLKSQANALRNCKRIEKLDDPITPVSEILKLCPKKKLVTLYKIPSFESVDDFLQKLATVRGRLKKGGTVDVDAVARIVLHDWNEGKIPYYTMPPTRDNEGKSEAKIVSEFSKEFDVDDVYNGESSFIGSLKSVDDYDSVQVEAIEFDDTMEVNPLNDSVLEMGERSDDVENPENGAVMDEDHEMEEGAENGAVSEGRGKGSRRQNEILYSADGILNTKLKRAEKKKRKKAAKVDLMDDDYDFKLDYNKASARA